MVFVTNFNTWASDMFERFKKDSSVDYFTDNYSYTFVYDVHSFHGSISIVSSEDNEFDTKIGIGVAYARFKGYEIPREAISKNLSQIPNSTDFYNEASVLYRKLAKHPRARGKYFVYEYNTNKVLVMDDNYKVYVIK